MLIFYKQNPKKILGPMNPEGFMDHINKNFFYLTMEFSHVVLLIDRGIATHYQMSKVNDKELRCYQITLSNDGKHTVSDHVETYNLTKCTLSSLSSSNEEHAQLPLNSNFNCLLFSEEEIEEAVGNNQHGKASGIRDYIAKVESQPNQELSRISAEELTRTLNELEDALEQEDNQPKNEDEKELVRKLRREVNRTRTLMNSTEDFSKCAAYMSKAIELIEEGTDASKVGSSLMKLISSPNTIETATTTSTCSGQAVTRPPLASTTTTTSPVTTTTMSSQSDEKQKLPAPKKTESELQQAAARGKDPSNLTEVLIMLNKNHILTEKNQELCIKYDAAVYLNGGLSGLVNALKTLDKKSILTEELFGHVVNEKCSTSAAELADTFIILHQVNMLTPENSESAAKHALWGLSAVLKILRKANILTQANFTGLTKMMEKSPCIYFLEFRLCHPQQLNRVMSILSQAGILNEGSFDTLLNNSNLKSKAVRSLVDSLTKLHQENLLNQENFDAVINSDKPLKVAEELIMQHKILMMLRKNGILTEPNRKDVENHRDLTKLVDALTKLHQENLLNQENFDTVKNHSNPLSLANAFVKLHQEGILTPENYRAAVDNRNPLQLADNLIKEMPSITLQVRADGLIRMSFSGDKTSIEEVLSQRFGSTITEKVNNAPTAHFTVGATIGWEKESKNSPTKLEFFFPKNYMTDDKIMQLITDVLAPLNLPDNDQAEEIKSFSIKDLKEKDCVTVVDKLKVSAGKRLACLEAFLKIVNGVQIEQGFSKDYTGMQGSKTSVAGDHSLGSGFFGGASLQKATPANQPNNPAISGSGLGLSSTPLGGTQPHQLQKTTAHK